jgi:hypothetical protein
MGRRRKNGELGRSPFCAGNAGYCISGRGGGASSHCINIASPDVVAYPDDPDAWAEGAYHHRQETRSPYSP